MNVRRLIRSVIIDRFPNPKSLQNSQKRELRAIYRDVTNNPIYAMSQAELEDPSILIEKLLLSENLYNIIERCLAKVNPPITGNPLHLVNYKFPLFDYQEEALQFMRIRESLPSLSKEERIKIAKEFEWKDSETHGVDGGILNMAMGLGKTYTVLARIMETRHESPIPTLVIVGASLISTWTTEAMDKFFPSLKYVVFHPTYFVGKIESFTQEQLLEYDVILTTYDFVSNTYGKSYKQTSGILQSIWQRNSEKGPKFPTDIVERRVVSTEEDFDDGEFEFSSNYGEFGFPEGEDKIVGKIIKNKPPVKKYGRKEYDKRFNLPVRDSDILNIKGEHILFFVLWPRMVCDESQRFRNPASTTYASLMSVPSVHCWCMTGTPMVNTSDDLFTQMRFIGYSGATKFADWQNWDSFRTDNLIQAIFIKDSSFLNLPPKNEVYDPCFFSQEEDEYYKVYLEEFLRNVKTFKSSKLKSAQGYILVAITHLRQMCVCPYMVLAEKKDKKGKLVLNPMLEKMYSGALGFGCAKFRKIKEILLTVPAGEKVLIFSFFKEFMPLLQLFIEKEKLGKTVMINGYKDPQERARDAELFKRSSLFNIAMISYSTGSEGLNLMCANHVILMEPYWNDAKMRQALARAYRKGQTKPVTVHRLYVERSIDTVLINLCRRKNRDITDTIEDASIEDGEIAEDDEHGERISVGKIEEIAAGLVKIEVLKKVKVNSSLPTSSSSEEEARRSEEHKEVLYQDVRYNKEQIYERLKRMFD